MSLKMLESKKEYVQNFINSYMKWYKEHNFRELDIMNEDLVMYFIKYKSYTDMQVRTLRKIITGSNAHIDSESKDVVLNWLKDEFVKYLKTGQNTDFDGWHKEICTNFQDKFNNEVLKGKYKPIQFGKAQKIVNMTIKYLSTCDNAYEYEQLFTNCHMVLDSFILRWYYTEVSTDTKKSLQKIWSNLSYDEYLEIQNKIRVYFLNKEQLPFDEEWEIWEQWKNK